MTNSRLTPEQIDGLRGQLVRVLTRLQRSASNGNGSRAADLDQSCVGRLSRTEALQNRGLSENLEQRERVQLEQVTAALQRMDEGNYGLCGSCAEPIPLARLQVFPETRTCTPCASA